MNFPPLLINAAYKTIDYSSYKRKGEESRRGLFTPSVFLLSSQPRGGAASGTERDCPTTASKDRPGQRLHIEGGKLKKTNRGKDVLSKLYTEKKLRFGTAII